MLHAAAQGSFAPHEIGWTLGVETTAPLLTVLAIYMVGVVRLRRRLNHGHRRFTRRMWLFVAGWLLLAGAIVSPLHEAGEVSFALHMLEHELIMLPAALLLVAGRPGATLMWGLPKPLRKAMQPLARAQVWRAVLNPVAATAIQAAVMVAWHSPALFDRALRQERWHIVQHLSFVASAVLFWWAMLAQTERGGRLPVAAVCLFVTSLIGGGLGALMVLSGSPWYEAYAAMGMAPFGLTPVQDQQLAGLIMWVPGGMFHAGAALMLLMRLFRQPQKFSTSA